MYEYLQYCYSTIDDAADAISSGVFFPDGAQIISYTSSVDTITFVTDSINRVITLPSCDFVGASFTGVTIADAIEVSWLAGAVLIGAWAVLILKRAF